MSAVIKIILKYEFCTKLLRTKCCSSKSNIEITVNLIITNFMANIVGLLHNKEENREHFYEQVVHTLL